MLCDILYLSFGIWGQYSGAKSQSHFSSSGRNSRVLNYLSMCNSRRILWSVDLQRWTNRRLHRRFKYFGRFFLLIALIYMSRTHPSCNFKTWLDWLDTPSSCGHKILYAICSRTACLHCTQVWTRYYAGADMVEDFLSSSVYDLVFQPVSSFWGPLTTICGVCETGGHILDTWSTDHHEERTLYKHVC
jgi:hypothetical protein